MLSVEQQSATAEVMYAEGKPLGVVLQEGLPFRPALTRFVRRHTGRFDCVDDVLQLVHFEAWQAARAGERVDNLRAFLFTVARRRAIDSRRVEQRQQSLKRPAVESVSPEATTYAREILARAKSELTPAQRRAWYAVRVEGLSMNEAARRLRVNRKSVYRLVKRAEAVLFSRGSTHGVT